MRNDSKGHGLRLQIKCSSPWHSGSCSLEDLGWVSPGPLVAGAVGRTWLSIALEVCTHDLWRGMGESQKSIDPLCFPVLKIKPLAAKYMPSMKCLTAAGGQVPRKVHSGPI